MATCAYWSTFNFSGLTQAVDRKDSNLQCTAFVSTCCELKWTSVHGSIFPYVQSPMMNTKNCRDNQNRTKTCPLDEISLLFQKKKKHFLNFLLGCCVLTTCYLFRTFRNLRERDLQFSFVIKWSFWSVLLDDVVFFVNEIKADSSFILSTDNALYCIWVGKFVRLHQM